MPNRIGFAIASLHISAVLNVALAAIILIVGVNDLELQETVGRTFFWLFVVLCLAFALGIEMTVRGLKQRKFWAWVVGLCICALYVVSLLFPIGAFGLWGLLAAGSRKEFGLNVRPATTGLAVFALSLFLSGLASATTVSIPEAGVSFEAPQGFTSLSQEEITALYVRGRPPAFVVGNEDRTTLIAYGLHSDMLPADKLPEVKAALETTFMKTIPDIQWKKKELISMHGQSWIYFEFVSPGTNNIMLVTSLRGKMLMFSFTSTQEEFAEIEPALRKSIETISLRPV